MFMTGGALPSLELPRIAVLGAGHVGAVIARVAIAAGYHVTIAASGDPERIALITQVLVPGAEPRWAADAVRDADIVVLAIPLHKFAAFDAASVAGKLVVDTMNYWPPGDGPGAVDVVAKVIERIGYDTVRLDSLRAGRLLEPGSPVFGVSIRRTEFELAVRAEAA